MSNPFVLLNSTNLQKPERFFYLPKEIVQDLKFQGNSNHFCLFSRICEFFRKFKKEMCSIIVGSNFSRHYDDEKPNGMRRIAKFVFSGLAILANLRILENMNFAILCTPFEFLNSELPWKVRAHNSWTCFFFEFSKNLENLWKKAKMIRIS